MTNISVKTISKSGCVCVCVWVGNGIGNGIGVLGFGVEVVFHYVGHGCAKRIE